MTAARPILTVLALLAAGWALWVLEGARAGLTITQMRVGPTPVAHYAGDGPPVVIAHGFAGSRQMMMGYATVLAQAGYDVYAFDFEGHGRHPVPMSGDVTRIDGTTRLLVDQTLSVVDAVPGDGPVALLGHSMATDVLVRVAERADRAGPLVLLSAFSEAITATHPQNMLLITGAWEPGLRDFALAAVRMIDPQATAGQTVRQNEVSRRAVLAPAAEHVSILHSRVGRAEALDWLNAFYGRAGRAATPPTGWALLALLAAITALAAPAARLAPEASFGTPERLSGRRLTAVVLIPALVAPLLAAPVDSRILPVLVADYLALHLAIYGIVQLALLWRLRGRPQLGSLWGVVFLLIWGLGVFGLALDRYGANFWPTLPRLGIIAALALGTAPFMLADGWAAFGAPIWQRVTLRLGFLASLALAVALDFEGLFFLAMIAPVIVLFYLTFGVMGRVVARRSGPMAAGLGLGLVLAWALGVSFPLFAA